MKCREALELFGDHVDGELGEFARCRLRLHVWVCRHCRRYLSSYRFTVRAGKAAYEGNSDETAAPLSDVQVALIAAAVSETTDRSGSGRAEP